MHQKLKLLRSLPLATKVVASLGVLGIAAGAASLGSYATFTSATSASTSASTGTVVIGLGATGATTNRLDVNASGVAPGDTVERTVDLLNTGTLDLAGVTLTTAATTSSLLDTDATDGLQLAIDACSVAWTEAGPPYTYTCAGATSSVLASRAVIGSGLALANLGSTTAGATDHLRLTLTLPGTAGTAFQGLTSTVQYTFTATQRAAGSR